MSTQFAISLCTSPEAYNPEFGFIYASDFTCLFIFVLFCIKISGNSNLKGTEHRYKKQLAGVRAKKRHQAETNVSKFSPYLSGCSAREPVPDNLAENSLLMNSLSLPKEGNIFLNKNLNQKIRRKEI